MSLTFFLARTRTHPFAHHNSHWFQEIESRNATTAAEKEEELKEKQELFDNMMDAIIEVVPAGKPAMKAVFVQVKNSCSGVEFTTLHLFVIDSLDVFGSFIANDASKWAGFVLPHLAKMHVSFAV